ncbi:Cytidylate kinase [Geodia barretti]|uniref:(d)CMP kinase n=1 Tax=Geodia barretti TaxID=519541 RepID=A0AA35X8Z8_GEOBA|nr:Cytidylate kinase [Geodia barretti]
MDRPPPARPSWGRQVAQALGCWFLDTGIMYRAVTWLALEQGVSPDDSAGLSHLTKAVKVLPVSMNGNSVEVSGRRVGPELREPRIDGNVSNVSRHPVVRRAMVEQQWAYAESVLERGGIVMIGRDIGTVVLPTAELKVYLTASAKERARRRCRDILEKGQPANLASVQSDIEARDAIDSSRDDSPLRPAKDAWQFDTTGLTIDQAVNAVLRRAEEQ